MLFDHSLADGVEVDEFGVETFYFDRHAPSFPALLYFYQKKEMVLYRPLDVPMEVFVEEVIFFELAQHVLEDDYEDAVEIEYRTSCIKSRNLIWARENLLKDPHDNESVSTNFQWQKAFTKGD